jgi:hypothetical protein
VLTRSFIAAVKGKPLTIEQSRLLKFLGIKLGEMILRPVAYWEKSSGKFEQLL